MMPGEVGALHAIRVPLRKFRLPREGSIPQAKPVLSWPALGEFRDEHQFRRGSRPLNDLHIGIGSDEPKELSLVIFGQGYSGLAAHAEFKLTRMKTAAGRLRRSAARIRQSVPTSLVW
jgi:hypothetical protein